uniref:Ig-like domain-containing protein n=1 Tax=Amphiprion percula TaxID=161767 RepID=A0A3P8TRZ5_AMPPE
VFLLFNIIAWCFSQKIITAALGQDVILPCKAPQKNIFILLTPVKWNRPGLEPEYKQHPSYKNRVDLQDKEMKDGDFSLVLKDVTMEDNGTYECWVFQRETNDWKTWSWKIETTINLEVLQFKAGGVQHAARGPKPAVQRVQSGPKVLKMTERT